MKKLVIHADDFGLSDEINQGIVAALEKGSVTSTSLLVNFPSSRDALSMAKQMNLDLGWHINLTEGRPISRPEAISSLVRNDGSFHPLKSLIGRSFSGSLRQKEIETELQAQLQTFVAVGIVPTHIDGHEHIHILPMIRNVVQKIVTDRKIPFVRLPCESGGTSLSDLPARIFLRWLARSAPPFRSVPFYGLAFRQNAGKISAWEKLLATISRSGNDAAEIMVHPSRSLEGGDNYPGNRLAEWRILMSPELKSLINKMGFQLTSFRDLV